MTSEFEPPALYRLDDLLAGYDGGDPVAFTRTFDFRMVRRFVDANGTAQPDLPAALDFAKHDAYIAHHLFGFIAAERPLLVGVMGGHSLDRTAPAYAAIARLTRRLTRRGLVVVTGGGPGAMEAAHLGAATAHLDDPVLDEALSMLSRQPHLPEVQVYDAVTGLDRAAAERLQRWLGVALRVRRDLLGDRVATSIAIPTWVFGNEPTNPFATHYAKFFDDSIREHSLVNRAKTGIVYAPGGGGTLRELFEDLEENYYAATSDDGTPMVLFDVDGCWTTDRPMQDPSMPHVRIRDVLTQAMRNARHGKGDADGFLEQIVYTDDEDAIEALLTSRREPTRDKLRRTIAGDLPVHRTG